MQIMLDVFSSNGDQQQLMLSRRNIRNGSVSIKVKDQLLTTNTYSVDHIEGVITFASDKAPAAGIDNVVLQYQLESSSAFYNRDRALVIHIEANTAADSIVYHKRTVLDDIQDDLVSDELYHAYRPTPMQFDITSMDMWTSLDLYLSAGEKLNETELKHVAICQHDGVSKWDMLPAQLEDKNTFKVSVKKKGIVGVFVNEYWYSSITPNMAKEFPIWTDIRQKKESVGQQFMNYFGMTLEAFRDKLDWVKAQRFIGTLNTRMMDWIYIYEIPQIDPTNDNIFYHGDQWLPEVTKLEEFVYEKKEGCIIFDFEKRRMYSRKRYKELTLFLDYLPVTITVEPVPQQVWNSFDEFGLLMGVRRLYLERNERYKERILDVFRYPANSGDEGLTNGVARELDLIQHTRWLDDSKNLYLRGENIDYRTLRVDGFPLERNQYYVDYMGHILIYAMNTGKQHDVSFIKNIVKYELHDKDNPGLHQLMFNEDGQASQRLLKWVDYINQVAPVMWNRFNWDEGYWDTIDKSMTGLGYVPNMWDSNIDIWKDYTFDPKRWEGEKIWRS